jgi:hypothetical protein
MGPPLVAPAVEGPAVLVTAHVGLRGDILGPKGFVDEGSDTFTLQGFALQSDLGALEYRVRYPDMTWSEWTPEGQFAGTRGLSIPITGFGARLREGVADKFTAHSYGRFVGGVSAESVDGADCVPGANEELRGLQISVAPRALIAAAANPA